VSNGKSVHQVAASEAVGTFFEDFPSPSILELAVKNCHGSLVASEL